MAVPTEEPEVLKAVVVSHAHLGFYFDWLVIDLTPLKWLARRVRIPAILLLIAAGLVAEEEIERFLAAAARLKGIDPHEAASAAGPRAPLRNGAQAVAYPSIVAGGPNACVLHYRDNNRQLQDGELLLIDAGCEYQGYASDITRTFPVNGRFTKEQRALHDLVSAAQSAALAQRVRESLAFQQVPVSLGWAVSGRESTVDQLWQKADAAMYEDKRSRRPSWEAMRREASLASAEPVARNPRR